MRVIDFTDGHAAYFKISYIQNNPYNGGSSATSELLLPDVIQRRRVRRSPRNDRSFSRSVDYLHA